jgi:hypothetical protein
MRTRCAHHVLRRHIALVHDVAHGLDVVPHAEAGLHLDPWVALGLALLVRGRARHVHQAVGVLACDAAHLRMRQIAFGPAAGADQTCDSQNCNTRVTLG